MISGSHGPLGPPTGGSANLGSKIRNALILALGQRGIPGVVYDFRDHWEIGRPTEGFRLKFRW